MFLTTIVVTGCSYTISIILIPIFFFHLILLITPLFIHKNFSFSFFLHTLYLSFPNWVTSTIVIHKVKQFLFSIFSCLFFCYILYFVFINYKICYTRCINIICREILTIRWKNWEVWWCNYKIMWHVRCLGN